VYPNRGFIKEGNINNSELADFIEKNADILSKE
jgi:hypothetical protein